MPENELAESEEPEANPGKKRAVETARTQTKVKRSKPDIEHASEQCSQVATKNDNAPVEIRDYDVWLVNNYHHPEYLIVKADGNRQTAFQIKNPAKIFVCKPGSYAEETCGQLFDAFCNLLICHARRNALQGLTAYLRNQDGGRMTEFVVKYHKKNVNGKRNRRRKRKRAGNKDVTDEDEPEDSSVESLVPVYTLLPWDVGRRIAFGHSGSCRVYAPAWTFKPHKATDPKKRAGCANEPWVELHKDISVGRDALTCLANASWWGWDQGSTLFFWRWPAHH